MRRNENNQSQGWLFLSYPNDFIATCTSLPLIASYIPGKKRTSNLAPRGYQISFDLYSADRSRNQPQGQHQQWVSDSAELDQIRQGRRLCRPMAVRPRWLNRYQS